MNKRTLALALAFAMSLSMLTACGGKTKPTEPAPTEPAVTEPAATEPSATEPAATEGVTMPLELNFVDVTLTAAGESFQLIPNMEITEVYFGSSDESVAAVDQMGNVIAVAPGTATILVENEAGEIAECVVRCNWTVEEAPEAPAGSETPSVSGVDLNAFVMDLANKHGENFAANANVVEFGMHNDLYPGIADVKTNQLAIYQPMMGAVVCEIALAEVADAADVETVKTIFQDRINFQVDGGAWYPESIEGWQNNSRIVTNGNFVMMIAWMYCDEAVADFNALF